MKIVQSYWSKPAKEKSRRNPEDLNKCGWPSKKHNYISWALSCLQFRKYYDEVELITDKDGYDLLIDKMELPYTSVKIVMNDVDQYPSGLFAIGKVYAYSMQDKPFIHADGDVHIWDKFDDQFERSALLCQNKEAGVDYNTWYLGTYLKILENFKSYPEVLNTSIVKNGGIAAVNAGILGGNNIGFFKYYATEVFRFVDSNLKHLANVDLGLFNLIFEQFLFHALAEDREIAINYYNPRFVRLWNDIADFTRINSDTKYIHMMGTIKTNRSTVEIMEEVFTSRYPDYYFKIIKLLRSNQA